MAKSSNNLKSVLEDIADAIREKTNTNSLIAPRNFADEILTIQTGSGTVGAQLYVPTIVIKVLTDTNSPLLITNNENNGNFVNYYDLYTEGSLVASIAKEAENSQTVNLRNYFHSNGTYTIVAKCRGNNMTDSENSNSVTYSHKEKLTTPVISISDNILTITAVTNATSYELYWGTVLKTTTSNLTLDLDTLPWVAGTYSLTVVAKATGYWDSDSSTAVSWTTSGNIEADPVLNNNTWAVIRTICESNKAGDYWSVGDTKTDVGTDGNTRTFRIVDMTGLYNKHVVFEEVDAENGTYLFEDLFITVIPNTVAKFSLDLQQELTDTHFEIPDFKENPYYDYYWYDKKLFIPSAKELTAQSIQYIRYDHNVTFQYYVNHDTDNDRIKHNLNNEAVQWWTRSSGKWGTGMTAAYYGYEVDTDGSIKTIPISGSSNPEPSGSHSFVPYFTF